jgi:predicted nuclease of restriction endonuclease-like (RecB) superfamily
LLPPEQLLRLSWTHFIELIRIDDSLKRAFYEVECFHGNWSIRQLQRQVGSLLYERTGLSTDKETVLRGAGAQDSPASVATLLRDPYVLEFSGLAERPSYSEADLESALLDHLQAFWNWAPAFVLRLGKSASRSTRNTTTSTLFFTTVSFAATSCSTSRSAPFILATPGR